MIITEAKEFTDKVRGNVRDFHTRLADAETPSPEWNAYRPEVVNEMLLKKRADVLRGLQLDLGRLKKTVAEKHAEIRKDRYADLYPDTASVSPSRNESARYYDWRANALLGVGLESHMAELRGLIELGEEGEYATRVYDWLKIRPMTDGERQKHGIDYVGVLADFEARRGFSDWKKIEKLFTDTTKELLDAEAFLNLPLDLQRKPATFRDWERQQEALGR